AQADGVIHIHVDVTPFAVGVDAVGLLVAPSLVTALVACRVLRAACRALLAQAEGLAHSYPTPRVFLRIVLPVALDRELLQQAHGGDIAALVVDAQAGLGALRHPLARLADHDGLEVREAREDLAVDEVLDPAREALLVPAELVAPVDLVPVRLRLVDPVAQLPHADAVGVAPGIVDDGLLAVGVEAFEARVDRDDLAGGFRQLLGLCADLGGGVPAVGGEANRHALEERAWGLPVEAAFDRQGPELDPAAALTRQARLSRSGRAGAVVAELEQSLAAAQQQGHVQSALF